MYENESLVWSPELLIVENPEKCNILFYLYTLKMKIEKFPLSKKKPLEFFSISIVHDKIIYGYFIFGILLRMWRT